MVLHRFADDGLPPDAIDRAVWHRRQAERLILLTNNRNDDGPDSLEAAICQHNTADSLWVLTIGNVGRLETSRAYAEEVVESLNEYLLRIEEVRSSGPLFLRFSS